MNRIGILLAVGGAALTLSACFSPSSVTCGEDGPTCPTGWACTADNKHCINPEVTTCGDGVKDDGEECDDGNLDNHDTCNWDCTSPECGDGFKDGEEVCDDGNKANGDGCSADCASLEVCGDEYVNDYTHKDADGNPLPPEACDGGGVNTAACDEDCTLAVCGDGKENAAAGELCDGGNPELPLAVDTLLCNKNCKPTACGDAYTNAAAGEQCDNGRYCADGTPCTDASTCAGLVGDSECVTRDFECCTRSCQNPLCGNGVYEPQCEGFPLEKCDEGRFCSDFTPCVGDLQCAGKGDGLCRTRDGAGCSANCLSPEECGDEVVNGYAPYFEACDDGKHCADLITSCATDADCAGVGGGPCLVREGTGCSGDCKSLEVCGDGILNDYVHVDNAGDPIPAEVCDHGRHCEDGTPCTTATECLAIGDGTCRTRNADGCSADCRSEETCGDGYRSDYDLLVVNAQPTCVPAKASCPAMFQGLTTVGVPFTGRELCDDGNTNDGDGCSSDCLSEEKCGDGYLNAYPPRNEICDDGNNVAGDGCAPDCKSTEQCGNNFPDPGEECDDGVLNGTDASPNGCSVNCTFIQCGNARRDAGEQCDEGTIDGETVTSLNGPTARCLADCICNTCGDTFVNGMSGTTSECPLSRFEECDAGGINVPACDRDCTLPVCGDSLVNFQAGEVCDNGPGAVADRTVETSGCNTDCTQAFCGDGKLNRARGEVCDDGNNSNGDGCSADCKSEEVCGDGIVNPYAVEYATGGTAPAEVCDLGRRCADLSACEIDAECAGIGDELCAPRDGVGCSADCLSEEECGDSYLNFDETCDDGNDVAGDGCGTSCLRETGWACATLGRACAEVCGDGHVVGRESCDDGKRCQSGVACTANAQCAGDGDGLCAPRAGDGCGASCEAEPGWTCPTADQTGGACVTVCGDLRVRPGETCDDGNDDAGDGCDASCHLETGWTCQAVMNGLGGICLPNCGDGVTRGLETCDDGDTDPGDGCDGDCRDEIGWNCPDAGGVCTAVCGDFVVRGAEACDDGNTNPEDGCDEDCQREDAWTCPTVGFTVTVGGVCSPVCGDGLVRGDEVCDDGDTAPGDGCDSGCEPEVGWECPFDVATNGAGGACTADCGDGLIRGTETCDEGTATPSGGCVACAAQTGWACPTALATGGLCTSVCGDGLTVGAEQCDDAAANDDRADCTSTCRDATCSDGLQHALGAGSETDVDCGGDTCDPCEDGDACLVHDDCESHYCDVETRRCETAPTPLLGDDAVSVLETSPSLALTAATALYANDEGLSASTLSSPAASSCGAVVAVSANKAVVTYTLPADPGACPVPYQDSFTYTVCSPFDATVCATATVHVTINRRPALADVHRCVPAGTTRDTLALASIYSDADGDALGTATATGAQGLASVSAGVVTWAPDDRDLAATYSVTLQACDDAEVTGCDSATWTAVWNDPPTLASITGASTVQVLKAAQSTVPLASIITDLGVEGAAPGGDPIASVTIVTPAATRGSCAIDLGADVLRYTAGTNAGADACFVRVCETCSGGSVCSTAQVAFNVVTAPVAVDDAATVLEGAPATGAFATASLVANDSDAAVGSFALGAAATSCGGTVTLSAGTVSYTAPANPATCAAPYRDSFTYTVCSPDVPTACDSATVAITINRKPTVADAFSCVPVNTASATLGVLALYTDPDGDDLDAATVSGTSAHAGVASRSGTNLVWTPTVPGTGFSYAIAVNACDDSSAQGCDASAWTAVWNDPPTLATLSGGSATALTVNSTATFTFAQVMLDTGLVTGVQAGDPIASRGAAATAAGPFVASSNVGLGTCVVDATAGEVRFTAGAVAGVDSCFVQVCEKCGSTPVCAITEIAFDITLGAAAQDDVRTVLEGAPAAGSFSVVSLLTNDTAGNPSTFTLLSAATACGGSVSVSGGTVTYTAPANPASCSPAFEDAFTYRVCSPSVPTSCDTATVAVTINRKPSLADAFSCVPVATANATLAVAPLFSDPDGDGLSATSVSGTSAHAGAAVRSGTDLVWTPTTPATAFSYSVAVNACDDSPAPGCDGGTWTAVWNDPPNLGVFTGSGETTVVYEDAADIGFTSLILNHGSVTGVASGDPIASVGVAATVGGPFTASFTGPLGDCTVDAPGEQVSFAAGTSAGAASCFVQVCEVCGSTPVCSVTELAFDVVRCTSDTDCTGDAAGEACDLATNTCVACNTDADCVGNSDGFVCDLASHTCGCEDNGDCASDACDTVAGTCTVCVDDAMQSPAPGCNAAAPVCDTSGATPVCVECTADGDCDTLEVCSGVNTCVECEINADCSGHAGGEACDAATNTCVGCVVTADCAASPLGDVCDTVNQVCVACLGNTDCVGDPAGEACDTATHTCVACNVSADCAGDPAGEVCDAPSHTCVVCLENTDCAGNAAGEACDPTTKTCVDCVLDADCAGDPAGETCDTVAHACVGCLETADCAGNALGEACDTTNKVCVPCMDDLDCVGDPAGEACDLTTHTCVGCVNASHCSGDPAGEACEPTSQSCVECVASADCTGHANGDVCDTVNFLCVACLSTADCLGDPAGEVCDTLANACVECLDDTACSGGTPACDTSTKTCVACTDNSDCAATPATPACDTAAKTCVACTVDTDCSGTPATPACDATSNTCVACTDDTDCSAMPATPACDETSNTCVACTEDVDCSGTAATAACADPNQSCVACTDNTHCAGNLGAEACDTAANVCVECAADSDCAGHVNGEACNLTTFTCGCVDATDCTDPGATGPVCDGSGVCVAAGP